MSREYYDHESMALCRSLNGWWDREFGECIVTQSKIPSEFEQFKECDFCGGHDAELRIVFNSKPASFDDVDVFCDKCIMKRQEKKWRMEESIWRYRD